MFKQGPVPAFVHGLVEYAAAILLIAAPFLFGFDDDTATAVSIVAEQVSGARRAARGEPSPLERLEMSARG